ncbi:hypothetical protein CRUP_017984 [Coryphaenoides rupestris]|nr:hypothetical protein CRUP_017984 [Coryphaenoides rupestris]
MNEGEARVPPHTHRVDYIWAPSARQPARRPRPLPPPMASGYPPSFEGSGEVKEGFICPLCHKDLQSFYQLQDHYEEAHSGDDRHVRGQLKSLVQKAMKAKDKLLKRDGDDRADTGSYESFYYGGVDPYMWEPQELGATRNHQDYFKKHRAARIDHYVIEVNKLVIRLEKLTSFDRTNSDVAKIRAIEKSVVPWVSDSDVPFCPDCGNKFNIRNRRHHCRLCGSGGMGSRRGSLSSLSSRLRMCMDKVDEKAPEYIKVAESLNAGETTYNLDTAGGLRLEKMIRYTATLFVQDKYEALKEKRKQEQEKKLQQERLASQESIRRRQESEKNRSIASTNGVVPPQAVPKPPRMTKAGGWLPSSDSQSAGGGELKDPLLQQIDNIQSFLRQAREARRTDEVAMLEENLRQLQDEYDQQQTSLAIALSQKLAREENLQQGEIQRLEARERSEWEQRAPAADSRQPPSVWECSLDLGEPGPGYAGEENKTGEPTPKFERSPLSLRAFPALAGQEESPPRLRSLGGQVTPPSSEGQNSSSLNPFEEEDSTPTEEGAYNPFFEDVQEEHKEVSNGKREYNPFDDEQEGGGAEEGRATTAQRGQNNPFEEDSSETGNPFTEASGDSPGNPFEGDEDAGALASDIEMIEEELLLQQIDNIRAYIFDAKINGRLDEVELLSTNLRELQHTLQEQKKAH